VRAIIAVLEEIEGEIAAEEEELGRRQADS
jgi:hypothetical protein